MRFNMRGEQSRGIEVKLQLRCSVRNSNSRGALRKSPVSRRTFLRVGCISALQRLRLLRRWLLLVETAGGLHHRKSVLVESLRSLPLRLLALVATWSTRHG